MFIIILTAKANQSALPINHRDANLQQLGVISLGEISDKLAADNRFIELIKIERSFQTKFHTLSKEDKQLFQTALKEKNTSTMIELFRKCDIDLKTYISSRTPLLKALDEEYQIDKRSDKEQIIRSAIVKAKFDPPTFAECMAYWGSGISACNLVYSGDTEGLTWCFSIITSGYLACLAALP